MGMVPIPAIAPLTLTASDKPVLEPPLPVTRVTADASSSDHQPAEEYSPSQPSPPQPDVTHIEPQPAAPSDPAHAVNLFA